MRVDDGRVTRRLPVCAWLALLVQLGLLLAGGAALLLAAAPGGWLALLLLASTLNLALAVYAWPRADDGSAAIPDPAPGVVAASPAARDEAPTGIAASTHGDPLRHRLRGLEADLAERERRLEQLAASRAWVRDESQLKSDYLKQLGRELRPLKVRLDALLADGVEPPLEAAHRRALSELRERLDALTGLLAGLVGEALQPARGAVRPKRVLIVDDGPISLMLARRMLEREALEVSTATSGSEALAWLERMPFDLVLMDIFMPGMDGIETSRRWRAIEVERYPQQRSVLIALTACASAEDRRRFFAAGLDDYLAKPYRPQELVGCVKRWLALPVEDFKTP